MSSRGVRFPVFLGIERDFLIVQVVAFTVGLELPCVLHVVEELSGEGGGTGAVCGGVEHNAYAGVGAGYAAVAGVESGGVEERGDGEDECFHGCDDKGD